MSEALGRLHAAAVRALQAGDPGAAEAGFRRVLAARPNDELALAGLASSLTGSGGDPAELHRVGEQLLSCPGPRPPWDVRGNRDVDIQVRHGAGAMVVFARQHAWNRRARAALDRGDLDGAGECLSAADGLDWADSNRELDITRARLWRARGEGDRADRLLNRVLLAAPDTEGLEVGQLLLPPASADELLDRFDAGGFRDMVALIVDESPGELPDVSAARTELDAWNALLPALPDVHGRWQLRRDVDAETQTLQELASSLFEDVHGVAAMVATLAGCRFVFGQDNDDERTWLAGCEASAAGLNPMYNFNPRQVELEPSPSGSMAEVLQTVLLDRRVDPRSAPEHAEGAVEVARRSFWLTGAIAGIGFGSITDDAAHAPAAADYDREKGAIASAPHLALYWICHHAIAGNRADLDDALAITCEVSHPWVAGARGLAVEVQEGSARLASLDDAYVVRFRAEAPERVFRDDRPAPPPPPAPPREPASSPELEAFRAWLAGEEMTQRQRAAAIEAEWLERLSRVPAGERALLSRVLKKAVKSPKLRAQRDAILAALELD